MRVDYTASLCGNREYQRGKYHCTVDLLFDWFWLVCFANRNKNCQFSYRWFQTSQTGGQQYSDTSPFSILWWQVGIFSLWSVNLGLKRETQRYNEISYETYYWHYLFHLINHVGHNENLWSRTNNYVTLTKQPVDKMASWQSDLVTKSSRQITIV